MHIQCVAWLAEKAGASYSCLNKQIPFEIQVLMITALMIKPCRSFLSIAAMLAGHASTLGWDTQLTGKGEGMLTKKLSRGAVDCAGAASTSGLKLLEK